MKIVSEHLGLFYESNGPSGYYEIYKLLVVEGSLQIKYYKVTSQNRYELITVEKFNQAKALLEEQSTL